jgi:hypothetical protein
MGNLSTIRVARTLMGKHNKSNALLTSFADLGRRRKLTRVTPLDSGPHEDRPPGIPVTDPRRALIRAP